MMNQSKSQILIEMISTGDEVLYGQILDTNGAWLSEFLFQEGIPIITRHTVGDNLNQLIKTFQTHSLVNDIIIVNGGLGPTRDDLTARAAALANHEILELNQEWLNQIERYFANRGKIMPSSNIKQAMLPKSSKIINNPVGTACGFQMKINDCLLFFTPGVPAEFKEMIQTSILPEIKRYYPRIERQLCYQLTTMGRSESELATEIETKLMTSDDINIGYRAAMPYVELKLSGPEKKKDELDKLWREIKIIVSDNLLFEGRFAQQSGFGLARVVSELLHEKNLTVAVIEQQSAGVIGHLLFESDAPIVKSEVSPLLIDDLKSIFLQILTKNRADIALGIVNFKEKNSQFTLIIATANQILPINLKYTGRKQTRKIEQQTLAAIALDALRRYLLNKTLIGPNTWLEIID